MFSRRARVRAATLLIGSLSVLAASQPVQASISETRLERLNFIYRFQQGKNYWNSASYLEAAAYFDSLQARYAELPRPLQLQVNYYYGASLHELGLYERARQQLKPLLDEPFAPDLVVDAAVRLIDMAARDGDRTTVETLYEGMARRPQSPQLRIKLDFATAQALYRLARYLRVRELALRIPPDSPEYPRALVLSAMGMIEGGELNAAEEDLQRILREEQRLGEFGAEALLPRVLLLLAQVRFDQGAYTKSLQTLTRLTDPAYAADVAYLRAWNQLMSGQYAQGAELLKQFAERFPEDSRAIEATVLAGYVLLNQARFAHSYAYFATAEVNFRGAAEKMEAFRRGMRTPQSLDLFLRNPARQKDAPFPSQVATWVMDDADVQVASVKEAEIDTLGLKVQNLIWDLQRMRVISAGFGSSFENPATLERQLRNEVGLRLTEIRSAILEMMVKPVRGDLLASQTTEYNAINMAQSVRKNALEIINNVATPTKERAVAIQFGLRKIQEYLYTVASLRLWGEADPAQKEIAEGAQFSQDPQQMIGRLIAEEERLAFLLLQVMEDEEHLWGVVSETIAMERRAAEAILRRLNLWGRQAYLDRLELLYRSTGGIEGVLDENGRLLVEIQKKILNDVIDHTNQRVPEYQAIAAAQERLRSDASQVRLRAVDRSYKVVAQDLREGEAQSAAGRLDVGWRIKEVESEVMKNLLLAEQDRLQKLEKYYNNVRERANDIAGSVEVLDRQLKAQIQGSVSGERSLQFGESLRIMQNELDKMSAYVDELLRGTGWILERGGAVVWTPEAEGRP